MGIRIQLLAIISSLFVIIWIVTLIRRRKLREEYAMVWLAGSLVLIVFSIWRNLLDIIADFVGVYYAPAILLLVAIFFGGLGFLHFSVVISKQADQIKTMAQELALLRDRLDTLTTQRQQQP